MTLKIIVLGQAVTDFLDIVERMRQCAVRRGQIGHVFAKVFHLSQRLSQLGILVGEVINIVRRSLEDLSSWWWLPRQPA